MSILFKFNIVLMSMTPNAMSPRKEREKEKTFKRDPEDYTDDLGKLVRFHDSSPIKKAKAVGKSLINYITLLSKLRVDF